MTGKNASKGRYTTPEGSKTGEYLAAFVCAAHAFCIGSVIGWTSPTLVILLGPDSPFPVSHSDASTIAAAAAIGQLIVPIISKPMIDKLGRKKALFIGGLPLVFCWALKYFAVNVWMLNIARFLGGLAFGSFICTAPIYLGEIASVKFRGVIGSTLSIALNIGLLFAYIITPVLSISTASAVFFLIAVTVQIAMFFFPESPHFLMMVGRETEAEEVLEKLRGKLDVSEELAVIRNSLNKNSAHEKGIIDSLKILCNVKQNRRAFIITSLFIIPQCFGGFVTIIVYGHLIFTAAGSSIDRNVAAIAVGATKLVASILTSCLVDRVGRKPLICIAGIVAGICNFFVGSYFLMKEYIGVDVSSFSFVPLVASVVLVFAFNVGLISVPSVLSGEVYATDIKAFGSCVSAIIGGIAGFTSLKLYLIVVDSWHIGHSVPFLGFGVAVLGTVITLLYITPETKGKNFAEIQELLAK